MFLLLQNIDYWIKFVPSTVDQVPDVKEAPVAFALVVKPPVGKATVKSFGAAIILPIGV